MKRLIFSLIGIYVFIAAFLSITISSQATTHLAQLTNWEVARIDLPFNLKDLEDASYDGLLSIGAYTQSFFQDTYSTLGQLAVWTDVQTNRADRTITSAVKFSKPVSTFASVDRIQRGPSIFQKGHDALLALAYDLKSFTQETMPNLPNPRQPLKQIATHIEKNLEAVALLNNIAKSLAIDSNQSTAPEITETHGIILGESIGASDLSRPAPKLLCRGQLYDDLDTASTDDDLFLIDPANCKEYIQPHAPPTPVYPPPR